jgi:hypothetical protein
VHGLCAQTVQIMGFGAICRAHDYAALASDSTVCQQFTDNPFGIVLGWSRRPHNEGLLLAAEMARIRWCEMTWTIYPLANKKSWRA